jgi:hypothetical protein
MVLLLVIDQEVSVAAPFKDDEKKGRLAIPGWPGGEKRCDVFPLLAKYLN